MGAGVADQGIDYPPSKCSWVSDGSWAHGLIYVVKTSHIIRGQAETNLVYIIQDWWRSVILAKLKTTVPTRSLSLACKLL